MPVDHRNRVMMLMTLGKEANRFVKEEAEGSQSIKTLKLEGYEHNQRRVEENQPLTTEHIQLQQASA